MPGTSGHCPSLQLTQTEILSQMLEKFSRAWSKRQRAKWLNQWAWTAIIKGSGLGWHKYHSKSGTAFLNFTFHLWCDVHRANIRKEGRILMAIWRRDLQCLSRATRAWCSKSKHRQRVLRFYFVRCYRRSWDDFVAAVVFGRCTRRAGFALARKTARRCVHVALREWSQTCWRERAVFWRRHCRAAREALRQAMQPSTYNDFLQRTEDVYGAIPGSLTLEETAGEDRRRLGSRTLAASYQLNSRSIGVMTSTALMGNWDDAGGTGKGRIVRGTPSRQEIHLSPPAASSPPALSYSAMPPKASPPKGRTNAWDRGDERQNSWREAKETSASARQLDVPSSSAATGDKRHKSPPWQKCRFSDSEDEATSPTSAGVLRTITPPSHARSHSRATPLDSADAESDADRLQRRDTQMTSAASRAGKSLGREREREREASRERQRDISPDTLLAQPSVRNDVGMANAPAPEASLAPPTLYLPNSDAKALLIKWAPQPRAVNYELQYKFRRLDNMFWGAWVTMSNSIASTRTLVPARKDAVYCFKVRAQTARGWGEWSRASAVFRATANGGAQFAESAELDGSVADDSEAIYTRGLAGKEGSRSHADHYRTLEPLSTPLRVGKDGERPELGRDAVTMRLRSPAPSFENARTETGSDPTITANAEIAPDISGLQSCIPALIL